MPLPPPRWWERLLGCRVALLGTGDAMQRHLVLTRLGLCETEDEASDGSDDDAAHMPERARAADDSARAAHGRPAAAARAPH